MGKQSARRYVSRTRDEQVSSRAERAARRNQLRREQEEREKYSIHTKDPVYGPFSSGNEENVPLFSKAKGPPPPAPMTPSPEQTAVQCAQLAEGFSMPVLEVVPEPEPEPDLQTAVAVLNTPTEFSAPSKSHVYSVESLLSPTAANTKVDVNGSTNKCTFGVFAKKQMEPAGAFVDICLTHGYLSAQEAETDFYLRVLREQSEFVKQGYTFSICRHGGNDGISKGVWEFWHDLHIPQLLNVDEHNYYA